MAKSRSTMRQGGTVDPKVAMQHAVLAVQRAWASEVPDFAEWGSSEVESEPLIIYDLNGERLFYDFNVRIGKQTVGVVRASANTMVGSPIVSLQLGPHQWSSDEVPQEAVAAVKRRDAHTDINDNTSFVCYCYPKIAVRV
ncbi:MAG: hypothetical protein D3923_16810, partial [Candidatus Electrothrix sp. AR3]|nr:hypothetical protein [Candidatus Electrothrix sp. AR3]